MMMLICIHGVWDSDDFGVLRSHDNAGRYPFEHFSGRFQDV